MAGSPAERLLISANVRPLFRWRPFLERFDLGRSEGFEAVEFPCPEGSIEEVVAAVRRVGLRAALINVHGGQSEKWAARPSSTSEGRAGEHGDRRQPAANFFSTAISTNCLRPART